jgi:hypothetical protein
VTKEERAYSWSIVTSVCATAVGIVDASRDEVEADMTTTIYRDLSLKLELELEALMI